MNLIENLTTLVGECGRGAAYDVREALGFDAVYVPHEERAKLSELLTAALREELSS